MVSRQNHTDLASRPAALGMMLRMSTRQATIIRAVKQYLANGSLVKYLLGQKSCLRPSGCGIAKIQILRSTLSRTTPHFRQQSSYKDSVREFLALWISAFPSFALTLPIRIDTMIKSQDTKAGALLSNTLMSLRLGRVYVLKKAKNCIASTRHSP